MRIKLIIVFVFSSIILFGQKDQEFNKLISEINRYLNNYSKLSGFEFGNPYSAISRFELSDKENRECILLTEKEDSILNRQIIGYLQKKITDKINQISSHPDFLKKDIKKLITSDELDIVISDDKKLFNFAIYEKSGGSLRSRISIMHYVEFVSENSMQSKKFQSSFNYNGYTGIYALETEEGLKYVMTSFIRFCSLCFETSVDLMSFNGDSFENEFSTSVESRDWNNKVSYDPAAKKINAEYFLDDLTPYCNCKEELNLDNPLLNYNCICKFSFNGSNFELAEQTLKKTINTEENISELLSFTIAENQKEVKLFVHNGTDLRYVLAKQNGEVEFSYPLGRISEVTNFIINLKGDSLTFRNKNVTYQIYEIREKNILKNLGILVTVDGNKYDLKGTLNSLKGSLMDKEFEKLNNVDEE